MKRLALLLVLVLFATSGATLAQKTPPDSVTGYLFEGMHRLILEAVSESIIGRPVKNLDPFIEKHEGFMNNQVELKDALSRDFASFRQPRLKVLSQDQADAWAARLEAGYIGIGATFEAVGFADGAVRVYKVTADTHSDEAGVRNGDFITAINGVAMKNFTLSEVREKLSGEPGVMLVLTVERNGVTRDVSIEIDLDRAIGLEVDFDEYRFKRYFKTGKLSEDSPAYSGGLREGDLVDSLNGGSVKKLAKEDFIDTVRVGPIGEVINFQVLRDGEPVELKIVRGIVADADPGIYDLRKQQGGSDNDIEYNNFSFGLSNLDWKRVVEMTDNIVEFVSDSPGGVLDLRGASGNDLDTAVKVAARFLNDGRVIRLKIMNGQMPTDVSYSLERFTVVKTTKGSVTTKDANGLVITRSVDSQVEIDRVAKKYYTGKLVVLVDQKTSGAAEVLAQILQTHNRATVVGRKSAGVNTLVSVRTIEGVTVQIPTTKIVELDGVPFKKVKPDTSSWFASSDREASKNALTATPWYWTSNVIAITLVCLIGIFGLGIMALVQKFSKSSSAPQEEPVEDEEVEVVDGAEKEENGSTSKSGRWMPLLIPVAVLALFAGVFFGLPRLLLGPPAGVTSKIFVELVRDDSKLSSMQAKIIEQLAHEYSGAIEFKILNFNDGPDVLEKSSDGFWKAATFELRPSYVYIRRVYYDAHGKPIPGKGSGQGMGLFTKAWLISTIEYTSRQDNFWPGTPIQRTKPPRN